MPDIGLNAPFGARCFLTSEPGDNPFADYLS